MLFATTVLAHHVDKVYCEGATKVIDISTGHTGNSTGYIYYTVYDLTGKVIQAEKRQKTTSDGHTIIKIDISTAYIVKFRCSKGDWNYSLEVKQTDLCKTTLPVKIYEVSAITKNNTLNISWKTGNSSNFSHFEIESSNDLKEIQTLGQTTNNFFNYTGNFGSYTRLKLVDLDNTFEYTKWVATIKDEDIPLILMESRSNGTFYLKNRQTIFITN